MNSNFQLLDYIILGIYVTVIIAVGLWVSRTKKGTDKTTEDYFLAGKSLPWWAIGSSLIAANISAEQFIGMSGSGFAVGLAIASYEWMAGDRALRRVPHAGRQHEDLALADGHVDDPPVVDHLEDHVALELVEELLDRIVVKIDPLVGAPDHLDDHAGVLEHQLVGHGRLQEMGVGVDPSLERERLS